MLTYTEGKKKMKAQLKQASNLYKRKKTKLSLWLVSPWRLYIEKNVQKIIIYL